MGARIYSGLEHRTGFGVPNFTLLWFGTGEAGSKESLIYREDEVTAGVCFMENCWRLNRSSSVFTADNKEFCLSCDWLLFL